jgi:hypothetical protein
MGDQPDAETLPDNTQHSKQTFMPPAGSEPAIPASVLPPGLVSKRYAKQKQELLKIAYMFINTACVLLPVLWSSFFLYAHLHFYFQLALLPINVPIQTGEMRSHEYCRRFPRHSEGQLLNLYVFVFKLVQ